jgi:hypothetical protein
MLMRRQRIARSLIAAFVAVGTVAGFIAYDQFSTSGGTKVSQFE